MAPAADVGASGSEAPRPRPLTPEDLYGLRLVEDPRMAPDGERIVYVRQTIDREADEYRTTLWLVPAAGGEPRQITGGPKHDHHPRWSPDGQTIAFLSDRQNEQGKFQIWLLPLAGGEAQQLTRIKQGVGSFAWAPDGRRLICTVHTGGLEDRESEEEQAKQKDLDPKKKRQPRVITHLKYKTDHGGLWDEGRTHLWLVDLAGNPEGAPPRQLTDGDWDDGEPCWSPDGQQIAFISNRAPDRDQNDEAAIWCVSVEGGEARQLTPDGFRLSAPTWSPDGQTIAALGHDQPFVGGAANDRVWLVPVGGGQPRAPGRELDRTAADMVITDLREGLSSNPPLWLPDSSALLAQYTDGGTVGWWRLPVDGGAPERVVGGDRQVLAATLDQAGRRLALAVCAPLLPNEIFSHDLETGEERQVTRVSAEWLDGLTLSMPEPVSFRSRDGTAIAGWLIKPVDFDPTKRYPAVLEVHGGPHAAYGEAFFHEFQILAGRGMVVLYTNPRGSQGYGAAWASVIRADWGHLDYEDVMAAADYLAALPYVDPERLGLTGGSYGGYMTNWVIGHSDRFKAAVTQRSVTNLYSFFGTSDFGWWFGAWEFLGIPQEQTALYLRQSPITYAANITTPLLILHSEQDLRCPIEQAEQLFVALKRLGREVVFVRFPDENHDLSRSGQPRHRVFRLSQIADWFSGRL